MKTKKVNYGIDESFKIWCIMLLPVQIVWFNSRTCQKILPPEAKGVFAPPVTKGGAKESDGASAGAIKQG
jgi:hypothetical protein